MFNSVIFESGNRKVIGEAHNVNGNMCNVLRFYEDDKEVLFARKEDNAFEYESSCDLFKHPFVSVFLYKGIKDFEISEIESYFVYGKEYWRPTIFFKNGAIFDCTIYEEVGETNFKFTQNGKDLYAIFKDRSATYQKINEYTVEEIVENVEIIYVPKVIEFDYSKKQYFIMYENQKIYLSYKALKRYICISFTTGNSFKFFEKTKEYIAKYKLAYGKIPELIDIDKNGYGIFEGQTIPSIN